MSPDLQTTPQGAQPADLQIPSAPIAKEGFTVRELWRVMMKQRFVILAVTILSVAGSLWYATHSPMVFQSTARIEIRPAADVGLQQVVQRGDLDYDQALHTEVHVLESDTVLFETAQSLNLIDRVRAGEAAIARNNHQAVPAPSAPITPVERNAMIGLIRDGLRVTILQGTSIIEITYRNGSPQLTAAVINRLIETYSDENLRSKYERTMHVSEWLQKQLEGLKSEASDAQRALAEYQKAHNIVGTDQNSNLDIASLHSLSESLDEAEADRITKEARMRDFDSMTPNMVALMGDNPDVASLRTQLNDLQTQRAQLSAKYGPKHPRMIELTTQINKVQGEIDAAVALARRQVRDEYQGAADVEQAMRQRMNAQEELVYKQNEGAAQYSILLNQAALTRDLYDTLQVRLKEATVTAGLSAAEINVVDSAVSSDCATQAVDRGDGIVRRAAGRMRAGIPDRVHR